MEWQTSVFVLKIAKNLKVDLLLKNIEEKLMKSISKIQQVQFLTSDVN
jgi:hypothetical protein